MATSRHDPDVQKATTPALFAAVLDDARELAIGHLERMQRETKGELGNLKRAIARIAMGVGIVIVGAILTGHALAAVMIALGLAPWAAYVITAALAVVGGVFLLKQWPEDSTDMDLVPEESLAALKRDLQRVKEAAQSA
ncbi:MAG TPA: phage holin family protein [Kofleriaceae bacterium]|nr:phage holin family protein [Kofleriaceae bacterium]